MKGVKHLNLNTEIVMKSTNLMQSKSTTKLDLDLINNFTLNNLNENDVFTFSITLCTNEIDRDFESFTPKTINKLADLFIGKTGIFDHKPNALNQSARIFNTFVEKKQNELTSFGEPKVTLKANAYTIKCPEFENLIKKINGGILKEVSISCQIKEKICSICNKPYDCCSHSPGQTYDGKKCFLKLKNPIDAYEWSFVPIPAQKGAHTVKNFSSEQNNHLQAYAKIGQNQKLNLKKQILKLGFLCGFNEDNSKEPILETIVNKMSFSELENLKKELETILLNKNFQNKIGSASCEQKNISTTPKQKSYSCYII